MTLLGTLRRLLSARDAFDRNYFNDSPWGERLRNQRAVLERDDPFAAASLDVVKNLVSEAHSGIRMVVNITADALLKFLDSGHYKNLYENPVVGGRSRMPSRERTEVDELLGFDDPSKYYFGAVALGGTGIRFYGEYCMVIRAGAEGADARLFDRDSYDLLLSPLAAHKRRMALCLRGQWRADLLPMVALKVLPGFRHQQRVATAGLIAGDLLRDQEFIEVHKRGPITTDGIEEIRLSPDELARDYQGHLEEAASEAPSGARMIWADRREQVLEAMRARGIRTRVVAGYERGYGWE